MVKKTKIKIQNKYFFRTIIKWIYMFSKEEAWVWQLHQAHSPWIWHQCQAQPTWVWQPCLVLDLDTNWHDWWTQARVCHGCLDLSCLDVATLCKYTMDQDIVYYRLAYWIFQTLKDWEGANLVFSHKVKLSFYLLVEKLKHWLWRYFSIFHKFIGH